jgi:alpha-glucosidase
MDPNRYAAPLVLGGWEELEGGGGAALVLDGGVAEVSLAADGSVRLRATAGSSLPPDPTPGIGRSPQPAARAIPRLREDGVIELEHQGREGTVRVEIDPKPLAVRVRNRTGQVLAEFSELACDPQGGARITVATRPGERFFGLGEGFGGLDKRGTRLRLRNRDPQFAHDGAMYVSIPFLFGLAWEGADAVARGLLLESFGPCHLDVAASRSDRIVLTTESEGIDVTLFPGPAPSDVLRRFTARVGRASRPPLWALGHHQSRWSYGSERAVRRLARDIRRRQIPTDVIHLDIDYMRGFRVFSWHPRRFPDPKKLIADLAGRGFRVVTIVDPGVKQDAKYGVYQRGLEGSHFCTTGDGNPYILYVWPRRAALPDFNRPETRDWWGEEHAALLDAGVAGIWNDMNEPAGWSSDVRLGKLIVPLRPQDTSQVVQSDPAQPDRTVPHEQVRNVYGHQECRATSAALQAARPSKRPFVLTRSGYAGIQRFAAIWTGDNLSRWSHLRESIPMLLNLSLSGVPFCGADIGGFALRCSRELYARWIQLGALYPFARTHSMWAKPRQEPWRFGRRVEDIARESLELRMRLLPYLYALFVEAEETGAPVWRPLFYEFPEDAATAEVDDQFLLGPWLMAAPVVHRGAREREVYLPPGVWMDWYDDARWVGPRRIRIPAPVDRLPLFVRGGAVLPTRSPVCHVGETPREPCVLEVFPGGSGRQWLVEDDGESLGGDEARTLLSLRDRAGGRLRLELSRREGAFAVPDRVIRVVAHGCPLPDSVILDSARLASGTGPPGYLARDGRVEVRFEDRGEGHVLELDPCP